MLNPGPICESGTEAAFSTGFFLSFFFGAGVTPQVSFVISLRVQHVLPSLLGNKPAGQPPACGGGGGGCGPQRPAAIISGEQHAPFTRIEGDWQAPVDACTLFARAPTRDAPFVQGSPPGQSLSAR